MPRHGNTRSSSRKKHQGHRAHKRSRLARSQAKSGRGQKRTAWGRAAV